MTITILRRLVQLFILCSAATTILSAGLSAYNQLLDVKELDEDEGGEPFGLDEAYFVGGICGLCGETVIDADGADLDDECERICDCDGPQKSVPKGCEVAPEKYTEADSLPRSFGTLRSVYDGVFPYEM